jgi:hypothetical protein
MMNRDGCNVTVQEPASGVRTGLSSMVLNSCEGRTDSASVLNVASIPNALTRQVMAETDAGRNIVRCTDSEDLFRQLGI